MRNSNALKMDTAGSKTHSIKQLVIEKNQVLVSQTHPSKSPYKLSVMK